MKKNDEKIDDSKLKSLENQLKRALADYQNLEKRIAEEKSSWVKSSNKDLISKLLPVLDDLFLANRHLNDEGLRLSIQKLHGILSHEGLEEIPAEGMEFNPNIMEAVGLEEGKEGRVIKTIRAGYKMHGQTLRPAQVIVGKETN